MKLVRCLKGCVWDVAVDLRTGSATFLRWYAHRLVPGGDTMVISEGFAHGFQVLEPDSELLYLHTAFHAPGSEGGFRYNDPLVAIDWPLPVSEISDRDAQYALLTSEFDGLRI
jgi:dTDP-4-dehydrorhamnose 3,5-epimerase